MTARWHRRLAEAEIAEKISRRHGKSRRDRSRKSRDGSALRSRSRCARPGELGKSAALVTPDRALARRVVAALGRWNLAFDDSGGDALMDTSAGIFARLAAETAAKQLEPPTLLALLKHPLCRLGAAPGALSDAMRHSNWRCFAARVRRREPAASREISRASALSLRKQRRSKVRRCMARNPGAGLMTDSSIEAEQLIKCLQTAFAP